MVMGMCTRDFGFLGAFLKWGRPEQVLLYEWLHELLLRRRDLDEIHYLGLVWLSLFVGVLSLWRASIFLIS
jgi:hypothetical protein